MGKNKSMVMVAVLLCAAMAMAEDAYPVAWIVQTGAAGNDSGRSVAVDGAGNVYMAGWTNESPYNVEDNYEALVTKYDPSGNVIWSQQIGTDRSDRGYGVAVDNSSGSVYISGVTGGDLGGPATGTYDAFVTKLDTSGNLLWSQKVGTSNADYSKSVAVDGSGNVYISGQTSGDLGGANAGYSDAFLVKFENPVPEPATLSLLALGGLAMLRRQRR